VQHQLHVLVPLTSLLLAAAASLPPGRGAEVTALLGNAPFAQPPPPEPWLAGGGLPPPPYRPLPASRPGSWPGGPAAEIQPCEGAQILGRVGSEVILASEILAEINEIIQRNKDRIPAGELQRQRTLLIQERLKQQIETKLIFHDAKQTIPEDRFPHIEESLKRQFEQVELKKIMERANAATRQELDQRLREFGTSLERQKRAFVERTLARQWIRQQVVTDEEITYDQMLDYYRDHAAEFDNPARARWEELTVRFSRFPGKAEARTALAAMGNQVLAGVPLAEVAKSHSHGPTASHGGLRDWTTQGSLVCESLDRALFGLPVGQLSPILESDNAFHIVRVIRREQAGRTPFLEAQVEIQEKIRQQRIKQQFEAYVTRLRKAIPVWTVFDDPVPSVARRPD
jgi:parvulin-like peptidyl-prolyl isomerase